MSNPACRLGVTLLAALAGAFLFRQLDLPLPWLLGPLLAVGSLRLTGASLHSPMFVRNAGQWIIGTALGLYFTPPVMATMATRWWAIVLGLCFAWVLSLLFSHLLRRAAGLDPATAFFAATVGGASEMAVQGERHGARVDIVVAVHSMRVLIVVVTLPFAYRWLDLHGTDASLMSRADVDHGGLLVLLPVTLVATAIARRLAWPNVWMIGPLLATIALTGSGHAPTALPELILRTGQVFIGMSLGNRFEPDLLRTLRRILPIVVTAVFAMILVSAGFALLLARLAGIPLATMVLATSPGGIAEMSLTAKLLQLGVPTVTVFHVTRLAFILLTVGPMWRFVSTRRERRT